MNVNADKRKLMHVESMATRCTHALITKSPTYSYVGSTVTLSDSDESSACYWGRDI